MKFFKLKTTYASEKTQGKCVGSHRDGGFTILETLVAISILILAITAPLAIIAQALRSSYYARDQVTAYYLAQEAVEFLRNKRDNAGLVAAAPSQSWIDEAFMAYSDYSEPFPSEDPVNDANELAPIKTYLVRDDTVGYKLVTCPLVDGCPEVTYDSQAQNGVLYGWPTGEPSIFTREIVISEAITGNTNVEATSEGVATGRQPRLRELVINVRVRWRTPDGTQSEGVTIIERLTNWQLEKGEVLP